MGETLRTRRAKARLLKHYRFDKGYLVGQEVEQMDILAINKTETEMIEIEIKITKADLQNELHKRKHLLRNPYYTPNKYYFCVPHELKEATIEVINKLGHPEYGIIDMDTLLTIRRAKSIVVRHTKLPYALKMRLSSDVANSYEKLINLNSNTDYFLELYIKDNIELKFRKVTLSVFKKLSRIYAVDTISEFVIKQKPTYVSVKYNNFEFKIYEKRVVVEKKSYTKIENAVVDIQSNIEYLLL